MKETIFQSKLVKKYKEQGYMVIRLRSTDPTGIPDLLLIKDSEVIFVEVKTDSKLSEIQKLRIKELREHKIKVKVITL